MAPTSLHPAAVVDFALQSTGGDDVATRVDVFEEIYLFFLILGTLVGIVVVSYMLHKAYKYRAGSGREYDIDRPELGELPTGADKGGRKLFLSFGLSAIIVISLVAWTYGWLLYVETGAAQPSEDAVEVDVVGQDFAWTFEYRDPQRVPQDQVQSAVDDLGEQAVADALRTARDDPEVTTDQALAAAYQDAGEDTTVEDVNGNLTTLNDFRVPVDREVFLYVTSGDVWHNFGIPEYRVKSDAIPDETTTTWFVAEEAGVTRAECFELCGSGHTGMESRVEAMPQDDFETWYTDQTMTIDEAIDAVEAGEFGGGGENGTQASAATGTAAATSGVIGA